MLKLLQWIMVSIVILGLNACGGGGSGQDNGDSGTVPTNQGSEDNGDSGTVPTNQGSEDNRIQLKLKASYQLPAEFYKNYMIDNDKIIIAGGYLANPVGAQQDGHLAFSNKIIKIDLLIGIQQTLEMNASSGHNFGNTINNGRSTYTDINKLDENKYLISGGFQYVKNMEIVDFNTNSVKSIIPSFQITDTAYGGFNTTTYFADNQGNSPDSSKNIYFFGFNNGLYGMNEIIKFNNVDENISLTSTTLTMSRSGTQAFTLFDGKIIIVGGWDGSAVTTPDSATRRVEIFNPEDGSIVRVSDYPEPTSSGKINPSSKLTNVDTVCIGKYQYAISTDTWISGCSITPVNTYNSEEYIFPEEIKDYGSYIATLSNGNFVFKKHAKFSETYSNTFSGYPLSSKPEIFVFEEVK